MNTRRFILGAAALLCGASVWAQPYPAKPIRFFVPFSAGSSIELMSRVILDDITKRTGTVFVVEPRPGALGQIGMDLVAKAAPDGYTLMPSSSATHSSGPQLSKMAMPDPVNAFTHLTSITKFDLMVVVNAATGVKTPEQLVAQAKTRKLSFGYGSATGQVASSAFARAAGMADQIIGAPYKGQPLAVTDLIGGHIDFVAADIPVVAPHIRSGKLNALGVMSDKRSALFPEVPTMSELGIKLELIGWVGFSGPPGLPEEVRAWWTRQVGLSMADPGVQEKFKAMGLESLFVSGAAFQRFVSDQFQTWGRHIREAGIPPQ